MILPIIIHPNQILRTPTDEVAPQDIKRPEIQNLIRNMIETMKGAEGVGLAAPQVDSSHRITVIDETGEGARAYINPYIVGRSFRKGKFEEGCLSIPGIYGWVQRPEKVTVKYYTEKGEKKKEKMTGMLARIVQHEIDHLDGVLFIDKVDEYTKNEQIIPQYSHK